MKRFAFLFLLLTGYSSVLWSQDTLAPVLECKPTPHSLVIQGTAGCIGLYDASLFIDTVYDNTSSSIDLGIQLSCLSDTFPSQEKIKLNYPAGASLEIWAKDSSGNTSKCQTQVYISDVPGSCDPGWYLRMIFPFADYPNDRIDSVLVDLLATHCLLDTIADTIDMTIGSTVGIISFHGDNFPSPGFHLKLHPRKSINPLNGVTTQDALLISKHILGIEPFTEPQQYIAADVNQDGHITTYDVVVLRKVILGISNNFPNNKSWRFWPSDYEFPNSANPLVPLVPEGYNQIHMTTTIHNIFYGVKLGDVNGTADPLH